MNTKRDPPPPLMEQEHEASGDAKESAASRKLCAKQESEMISQSASSNLATSQAHSRVVLELTVSLK